MDDVDASFVRQCSPDLCGGIRNGLAMWWINVPALWAQEWNAYVYAVLTIFVSDCVGYWDTRSVNLSASQFLVSIMCWMLTWWTGRSELVSSSYFHLHWQYIWTCGRCVPLLSYSLVFSYSWLIWLFRSLLVGLCLSCSSVTFCLLCHCVLKNVLLTFLYFFWSQFSWN